jgi:hypothetical protein
MDFFIFLIQRRMKLENINDNKEGTPVPGGNGYGNQLNQLNCPQGLFVDK